MSKNRLTLSTTCLYLSHQRLSTPFCHFLFHYFIYCFLLFNNFISWGFVIFQSTGETFYCVPVIVNFFLRFYPRNALRHSSRQFHLWLSCRLWFFLESVLETFLQIRGVHTVAESTVPKELLSFQDSIWGIGIYCYCAQSWETLFFLFCLSQIHFPLHCLLKILPFPLKNILHCQPKKSELKTEEIFFLVREFLFFSVVVVSCGKINFLESTMEWSKKFYKMERWRHWGKHAGVLQAVESE